VTTAFPDSLSLKGRGTAAQRQGEGVRGWGKTPVVLLERARRLRVCQTEAEAKLWARLRGRWLEGWKFRRQVAFSADYIADFVCAEAKLVVELDGSQHTEQVAYDERRTRFFEGQGYRVLPFWNNDAITSTDHVLEAILAILSAPHPAGCAGCPSPLQGEGY
jgi:very-short-patch-repair endonuclease